jgi:hypothetical protein
VKHTCLSLLPSLSLSLSFTFKNISFFQTGQKQNEERGDVLRYSITKQTCFERSPPRDETRWVAEYTTTARALPVSSCIIASDLVA